MPHNLTFGRSKYTAPAAWHECTHEQWVALVPFCLLQPDERTDDVEMEACRVWVGVSVRQWERWSMARWQWGVLRKQFAWIFEKPTIRPFVSFFHQGTEYLTAKPDFADSSALDVAWANLKFTDFAHPTEPRPEALDELVATLCRPRREDLAAFRQSRDWNGDERQPFNEQRVSEWAAALKTMPFGVKAAVLVYFEHEMKGFLETYGELFGSPTRAEPRYAGGTGWVMMLKNVAKEGHFGPFDAVCRQPAHLVWAAALDDVLDKKDQQEAQNQQNGYQPA